MKTNYPYDPDANLSSNYVTESVSTNKFPNKFNVVVPEAAPFYRLGLEVKDTQGRFLIEGLDYFLAYYYKELAEGTGKAAYGGIMLPDHIDASVKLRTVGGNHLVPVSEIGRQLTDPNIQEPRNVDFSELQRYPAIVEPVDKPENIEEAIARDVIVGALDNLRQEMETNIGDLDVKYGLMIDALAALSLKICNHGLDVHHLTPHQHMYTREDLNVLGEAETAADSIKAYGLTLQQVVDNMITFGINEKRVDNLLNKTLARTVKGRIFANSAGLTFNNKAHPNTKLKVAAYGMEISSDGDFSYEADTDYANAGIGVEIGGGLNVLLVPSSGAVQGAAPSINGRILITEDNVLKYLFKPTTAELDVKTDNSSTFEFYGRGNQVSPLKGQATPPHATKTINGLFRLSDSTSTTGAGYAISQFALTAIRDSLAGYIDKDFTINGEVFGEDEAIVIDKGHIGLGNAQDTSPEDKPITTAMLAALQNKAASTHTHSQADLQNVPIADHDTEGLAQLHDAIDESRQVAATPKQGLALQTLITDVESDVDDRVKAGAASATHFGGDGYLPVPVLGNYGHANYSYPSMYGEEDRNNKFVVLVNLASAFGRGVFYHEIQMSDTGAILSHSKTSVEYVPPFIEALGRKVEYVFSGYQGVFSIRDNTGVNWLVMTNGTMDMSKHIGCVLVGASGREQRWFIHGGYIYRAFFACGSNNYFTLARVTIAACKKGEHTAWETLNLKGDDMYGNPLDTPNPKFAPIDMSEDENAQSMVWRNDGGKWSHVGVRHSGQNWDLGVDGNEVVLYAYQRAYCSNSYSSSYGRSDQTTSVKIDLNTMNFTIVNPELMKLELTEKGIESQDPDNLMRWAGIEPNSSSCRIHGKNFAYHGRWYGTHATPYIYVYERKGLKDVDLCGRKGIPTYKHKSSSVFNGPTPSVIQSVRSAPCWKDDTTLVYRDMITGLNECKVNPDVPYEGDAGLGPTTDRKTFSGSFIHVSRIPRIWIAGEERSEGYTGKPGDVLPTKMSPAWEPENTRAFNLDSGTQFLAFAKAEMLTRGDTTEELYRDGNVFLNVFGDPENPYGVFLVYAFYHYKDDTREGSYSVYDIYEVGIDVIDTQLVIDKTKVTFHHTQRVQGSTTSLSMGIGETPQSMCYRTEEGILGFALHNNPHISYVGNSGRPDILIEKESDGTIWKYIQMHYTYQFTDLWGWHPKFGFYRYSQSGAADAIVGYPAGFKSVDIRNRANFGTLFILASTAEEGWIVYFTQPMPYYCQQELYSVAAASIDLRVLFPDSHQNNTFYIHVELVGDTPVYKIEQVILPDTETRLWIGHVTTDDSRIVDLVVERAKRLGNVATLIQHEQNKFAHGYEFSDTLSSSQYALMENKGMIHEFELLTFKDIFDSWYRFSHNSTGVYPAKASELTAWRYIEEFDCVECTINSATYIGFISDKKVGDYTFNTLVTAADVDDDTISIILAAHKQGDVDNKEHTLSLVMTRGGNNGSFIRVNENYTQSGGRLIRIIDSETWPPNTGHPWSSWYGHAYARRVNSKLILFTLMGPLPALEAGQTRDEMISKLVAERSDWDEYDFRREGYFETVIDLAQEAPMFNTATRFGYGALSQNKARYWNIERPLSDLGDFYSSEQMLHVARAENSNNVRKFHGTISRAMPPQHHDNYCDLFWAKAQALVGGGMAPVVPGAINIAPTPSFRPPKGISFYTKKRINFASTTIKIKAMCDDVPHLWIDGVKKTITNGALATFTISPGIHTIVFAAEEVPNLTPCYINFGIYDNDTVVDKSDTTWPCSTSGDYYLTTHVVGLVEYIVESGYKDTFAVQPDLGQADAVGQIKIETTDLGAGRTKVSNYIDMTKAPVARWDVAVTKDKLNQ